MARFLYKMQNILDIKEKLEEQAKMEYAQARIRLNEEEDRLAHLRRRKSEYESAACGLLSDTLKIREIKDNHTAIRKMQELIASQKIAVAAAERALEAKRQKLQEVMQERKTQEKLKEHAFEDFVRELNSAESKEIDELTSYSYGQKRIGR